LQVPLSASDVGAGTWRTATLVASLVAAVELVAIVVLAALLIADPFAGSTAHHATKAARMSVTVKPVTGTPAVTRHLQAVTPKLSRAETGILVLNGNGRTGAAAAESARLNRLGYRVDGTGNAARNDYATTVVMYRPGYRAEGIRLARDLRLEVVGPLDGLRVAALRGATLALILGVG